MQGSKRKTSNKPKPDCYNKLEKEIGQVTEFLKIISEKNRLKILCFLGKGENCVGKICQALKLPQNLVSHHLKVLKNFNLVLSRKEGAKNFYKINQKTIDKNSRLLNKFLNLKK